MAYAKVLSIPEEIVEMTLKTISRLKRAIVKDPNHGIPIVPLFRGRECTNYVLILLLHFTLWVQIVLFDLVCMADCIMYMKTL